MSALRACVCVCVRVCVCVCVCVCVANLTFVSELFAIVVEHSQKIAEFVFEFPGQRRRLCHANAIAPVDRSDAIEQFCPCAHPNTHPQMYVQYWSMCARTQL